MFLLSRCAGCERRGPVSGTKFMENKGRCEDVHEEGNFYTEFCRASFRLQTEKFYSIHRVVPSHAEPSETLLYVHTTRHFLSAIPPWGRETLKEDKQTEPKKHILIHRPRTNTGTKSEVCIYIYLYTWPSVSYNPR